MDLEQLRRRVRSSIVNHPATRAIHAGTMNKEQFATYMTDVLHYAIFSPRVIGQAACRLTERCPDAAEYLFRHAQEECGHDVWAREDLSALGWSGEDIARSLPSDACRRMLAMEHYFAYHHNPMALFGWMYVLESLGGDVAGALAERIDACLNLGKRATSFLAGHGEADVDHARELTDIISRTIVSEEDQRDFLFVVRESETLYTEILDHAFGAAAR